MSLVTFAGVASAVLVVLTAVATRLAIVAGRGHALTRRLAARAEGRRAPDGLAGLAALPSAPAWFDRWLGDAGIDIAPATAWWAWLGAATVAGLGALVVGGSGIAVVVAAAAIAGPVVMLRSRRGQGDLGVERALPAGLEAVARSLRSGASLRQAIQEAAGAVPGRLGRELHEVARAVASGATLLTALEALAARRPLPGVRLAVAALCVGVETGGAQARAVDGVAATLRDRLAVAAEVRALSSQARVSALVIGLAPLGFGCFAIATDPRTGRFLFHTPVGLALVVAGVMLDGMGWLWMQHLARVQP